MDAHKNFAYSTVATAPSPATSGTSLVVASGGGALFPAVPFNATIWPTAAQPTSTTAEIVRVTGISTDTLTITRAQESTSARTVVVGDQIAATVTVKTLTDLEAANNAITASGNAATVPVTSKLSTVTNNSAATLTITITTTAATDGQALVVRVLDSSAAAQTIAWVNTENSAVTAPVLSNGSTTLFLTVGFVYNNATSKWRCVANA